MVGSPDPDTVTGRLYRIAGGAGPGNPAPARGADTIAAVARRMAVMAKLRAVRLAVHLPLLGRCHEDFAAMPATPGGRGCARCEHVVHDLSAMTEREAARFVTAARGKRVCMRYVARADGTIEYRQEPPARLAPALMVAALAACTPHEPLPQIFDAVGVEVVEVVAPPRVVVVPETPPVVAAPAVVEPPDDDINPCPPPLSGEPKAKKRPPPGRKVPKEPEPVEYLGFEG
jgi:hypothetical protein